MKAWALTLTEVAVMGAVYWGFSWLLGSEAKLSGWIMSVAALALLRTNQKETN